MDPRHEPSHSYQSGKYVERSSSTSCFSEESDRITDNLAYGVTIENVEDEEDTVLQNEHPIERISSGEILNNCDPRREDYGSARSGYPAYCQIRDQVQSAPNNGISQEMSPELFYTQRPGNTLGNFSTMMRRMMSIPGRARRAVPSTRYPVPGVEIDTTMGYRNPYDCSSYQVAQLTQQDSVTSEEYMQYHQNAPQKCSSLHSSQVRMQSEPPEQQQHQQSRNYSGASYLSEDDKSEHVPDKASEQFIRCSCNRMRKVISPTQEASCCSTALYDPRSMDSSRAGFNTAGTPNLQEMWRQTPCTCGSGWRTSGDGSLNSMHSMPQTSSTNHMAAPLPPPWQHLGLHSGIYLNSGIGHAPFPGVAFNTGVQTGNNALDHIQSQSVYSMDYKPINMGGNVFNHFPNRDHWGNVLSGHDLSSSMSWQGAPGSTYMMPPAFMPPCIYGYPASFPMAYSPQPGAPYIPEYAGYGPAPPEPIPRGIPQPACQLNQCSRK